MAKRSKSSKSWLREHFDDEFVKKAQQLGLRSRAAFKLEEIDQRDKLLRPGSVVVDLGAAPGGWSQYAARKLAGKGRVVAIDILPMDPLPGVEFVQADFTAADAPARLLALLDGAPVDLVISDMAPNISGEADVDQARGVHLGELALDFATQVLRPGGALLMKAFQGAGYEELVQGLRAAFGTVAVRKPKASRARSAEVYLLARERRTPR